MNLKSLTFSRQTLLWVASFLLVAFGQPVWTWWGGLIVSLVGFALFWRILLDIPQKSNRFFIAAGWYASVQIVQLSWMLSHPYLYIYGVVFICAWLMGAQFGLLALFIQPRLFESIRSLISLAALWVILEWSRLFILSGLAFNPIGIALTGALYPLQFASLGGVYLLSFWVLLTNLFALRIWVQGVRLSDFIRWGIIACVPYLFGIIHFHFHAHAMKQSLKKEHSTLSVVLVQTSFPVEENMSFISAEEYRQFVIGEWSHILSLTRKHFGHPIDFLILPEYVVPFGTYQPVFPLEHVRPAFANILGKASLLSLPPLEEPYASYTETNHGSQWLVSNAFWAQALANIFQTDVVIGLEDTVQMATNQIECYSAAFHFSPRHQDMHRYEKRVLVPMGEYIPFDCCRSLAAQYGIQASFTCGKTAKTFTGRVPFSPSICYEEMYGDLIREGRLQGAELLVNLTNDGWYPHSKLPRQHFDHARLRTVENGIPLIRACNTGVTGAIDSLGNIINILEETPSHPIADAIRIEVPTYHYPTLYARWGDAFIIGLCSFFILVGIFTRNER